MTVWMSYLYSTLQVSSRKHSLEPMLNPNKQLRQLLSFFSPSSWLEPLSVSLHFTSPSPSLHLLASFSTKPCHRHDCGHVNHLASIICSQLFTSSQTKESAFFCCRWGGVLRRLRAVIQQRMPLSIPLIEKPNSAQRINEMGEETRRKDVIVGRRVEWTLGQLKAIPLSPKEQTGHKGGTSQANVKSK